MQDAVWRSIILRAPPTRTAHWDDAFLPVLQLDVRISDVYVATKCIHLHFCSNKRASDFQNHLLASHNIEKGSVNTTEYRFPMNTSLESLEAKDQFKLPGMNGIAIRRSHPPPRARSTMTKAAEPVVVISGAEDEGTSKLSMVPYEKADRMTSSHHVPRCLAKLFLLSDDAGFNAL